ncbi:hypothetical protein [Polycladidibacter hongkongensis]|uniref:hypothetical protein n=1 Tax=Polycladidibacter hongkongensis TaxID=1647556 RepID=UPI00082A7561|nr:hypothetical protein [Pseudovibrio hongkongensis]
MSEYEFDLIFDLPDENTEAEQLERAVYSAGYTDAVLGTGRNGVLGVSLVEEGSNPKEVISRCAREIQAVLPEGSRLHEVRPDLVNLAEVASKLGISRQAFRNRKMPSTVAGLYRLQEVHTALLAHPQTRAHRLDFEAAAAWFAASEGATEINYLIASDNWEREQV